MRRALEAESDKKKRRQMEKQWKAKIAALDESADVCTSDLSSFRLIDMGKSKAQLAAEQREEEARLDLEKKVDAYRSRTFVIELILLYQSWTKVYLSWSK